MNFLKRLSARLKTKIFNLKKINFLCFIIFVIPIAAFSQVPIISSFNPTSGPVGTRVTLSGSNFNSVASNNIVFFGATRATVVSATNTQLIVTVPSGATAKPISVATNALIAYTMGQFVPTFEGDGTFVSTAIEPAASYSLNSYPGKPVIKDMDGDGKADIIITDGGGAGFVIFRNVNTNKGAVTNNSFANKLTFGAGEYTGDFVIEDFNGDGKPDVAAINNSTQKITVLINTSTPNNCSFTTTSTTSATQYISSLATGDVNGDGKPDIITTDNSSNKVAVLINKSVNNSVSFTAGYSFAGGRSVSTVKCADLDGDGKVELVVGSQSVSNGGDMVSVYLNTSTQNDISFVFKIDYQDAHVYSFKLVDVDSDGLTDLAISASYNSSYYFLRNISTTGTLSFAPKVVIVAQRSQSDLMFSDLNGDGKLDAIIRGNSMAKNTSTNGNISFEPQVMLNIGDNINDSGDIDGDGKPDLVATDYNTGVLKVYRNKINEPAITLISPEIGLTGTVINITGTNLLNTTSITLGTTPVASYMINSPTSITAVVGTGGTGNVTAKTQYGTGTGTLFIFDTPGPIVESFSPRAAPVNTQVIIKGKNFNPDPSKNIVFFGVAKAQISAASATELVVKVPIGATYQPLSVTSNGLSTVSNQSFSVTFSDSGPIGVSTFGKSFDMRTPGYPTNAIVADLDLDGKIDLIVQGGLTFSVFKNTSTIGNTSFAARQDFAQQKTINNIASKDIDGDGKPDLLFTNATGFVILKNTSTVGNLSFATPIIMTTENSCFGIVAADFDNDGKLDIAVAHNSAEKFSIFRNTSIGNTISFALTIVKVTGYGTRYKDIDGLFARDLNNDGRIDLVTTNYVSANQDASVYQNTSTIGNISFQFINSFTGNYHPKNVILEDMDGDGLVDLLQATSRNFFTIIKNKSTTAQISFNPEVTVTTVNTPSGFEVGDIDGDGKPELAISDGVMTGYTNVYRNISANGSILFAGGVKYLKTNTTSNTGSIGIWESPAIICDFDGDGKPDICGTNGHGATVSISTNLINGPAIDSFTPTSAGTGISVNIKGANFTGVTEVKFGGSPAASFTIDSPTSITAVVGIGATGNVTIMNPISTSTLGGFKYLPSATISSFTPMAATHGESVTISGTNFTDATEVKFGGIKAKSFYVQSATTIVAVVDQPSASGSIVVTVPSGPVSLAGFVYAPRPVINSFSPMVGNIGTEITITGENFSANPQDNIVYFGATQAKVNTANAKSLNVTVPVGATHQPMWVYNKNSALGSHSHLPFDVTFNSKNLIVSSDFSPKVDYTASNNLQGGLTKDIDGDGKVDLITVNGTSNTVSIYRNVAVAGSVTPNSFAAKIDYQTGKGAQDVAVGDLDGDGKPDMAVVNFSDHTISVYRNLSSAGNVSFSPQEVYPTGIGPFALTIADIDKDGKSEMIVANFTANSLSIFQNLSTTGNLKFMPKIDLITGAGPRSVAVGDIDNDGKSDIITANYNSNTISVFRNISVGGIINVTSFETRFDQIAATSPHAIELADLDQDQKLEVIVAGAKNNSVAILSNLSRYNVNSVQLATGSEPKRLVVGDMNGDGQPDIVVANAGSNTVSVFRNTMPLGSVPAISFAAKIDLPTALTPTYVMLADIDGDGKSDVLTTNAGNNTFSVLQNNPGTQTPVTLPPVITNIQPAKGVVGSTATINGANFNILASDNVVFFGATKANVISSTGTVLTVVVPSSASYQKVTVLDTRTRLMASSNIPYSTTFPSKNEITANDFDPKVDFTTGTNPSAVTAGDLNGDGKPELIVTNFGTNSISVFRNNAVAGSINNSTYSTKNDFVVGTGPQAVKLADLDGDGKLDIIVANKTANTISLLRNTSTATIFSFDTKVDFACPEPNVLDVGDIDNDGKPDILVLNDDISIFLNQTAAGVFTSNSFAKGVAFHSASSMQSFTLSDMNNDGKQDIVTGSYSGFEIMINRSNPGFLSLNDKVSMLDAASGIGNTIAVSDVDDDGKPDIILGGDKLCLFKNIMVGNALKESSFEKMVSFFTEDYTNSTGYSMSLADMDGDGKPDIVHATNERNQVLIFRNISTPFTYTYTFFDSKVSYPLGNKTVANVVIDVDGDGKQDIVVLNPTLNTFSILPNRPKTPVPINAPVINSMSPSFGPIGTVVTLTGKNFSSTLANNVVNFGGISARVTTATATQLTVAIPVGTAYDYGTVLNTETKLIGYTPKKFGLSFNSKKDITKKDFEAPVSISQYTQPFVRSADIDGDGKPDLVTLSGYNVVYVMRNVSTIGSITLKSFSADYYNGTVGKGPQVIKIADVDGNGKPDILVTYYSFDGIGISVLLNNSTPGNISFAQAVNVPYNSVPYGGNSYAVEVGDVDGNGKPDILIANSSLKGISVLQNECTPGVVSFNNRYDFEAGRGSSSVNLADMDRDGKPDLIATNLLDHTVSILKNISPVGTLNGASFATHVEFKTINTPIQAALADLNGDGKLDIVVGGGENGLSILENTTENGKITSSSFASSVNIKTNTNAIEIADMDGDNYPDIVVCGKYTLSATIIRNLSGSGTISRSFFAENIVTLAADKSFKTLALVDIDGDGKTDITGTDEYGVTAFRNNPQPADPPTLSIFTPAKATSDETVTLTGTNFVNVLDVTFGNVNAKSFTVISPTKITAIIGEGQSGEVAVKTETGRVILTGFTYIPSPKITGVSPDVASQGDMITITGMNFTGATSVSFGGINAASFKVVSATVITAVVADGANGNVVVTTPEGIATYVGFKYNYTLPLENFKISTVAVTCKGSKNGTIKITATRNLLYTATVTNGVSSSSYPFTNTLEVNNLLAGNYNVCITLAGQPSFKQCFDVVVSEPKDLSLYVSVKPNDPTVTLSLAGASIYYIELSGKKYQTMQNEITLPLNAGTNILTLKSDVTCQGIITKTLLSAASTILFSPNPVERLLQINMGPDRSPYANVEIYSLSGQRLYQEKKENGGLIEIDMGNFLTGVYLIKVRTETGTKTSKILKK